MDDTDVQEATRHAVELRCYKALLQKHRELQNYFSPLPTEYAPQTPVALGSIWVYAIALARYGDDGEDAVRGFLSKTVHPFADEDWADFVFRLDAAMAPFAPLVDWLRQLFIQHAQRGTWGEMTTALARFSRVLKREWGA